MIVVVSGHSGSGKTTLCRRACESLGVEFSVSATTRKQRREGERDGVDYCFLSREEFERRLAEGFFAESADVFGEYYGTPRKPLDRALREGRLILVDCDIQGARSLRELYGDRVASIFVRAPSIEALRERLRARGTESDERIERRLERVAEEMKASEEFDSVLVNGDLDRAANEFVAGLEALQRRTDEGDH